MTLPPRRKPKPSGIERAPKRDFPRHRKFVRSHACCVPFCQETDIEFAHVRSAENSGTGLKPADYFGVSLCHNHHREQHDHGAETFARKYGIDLWKLAAEFSRKSPDTAMRLAMKEQR
jgi:hypothetical protein